MDLSANDEATEKIVLAYNISEYVISIEDYIDSISKYDLSYNVCLDATYEYVSELYNDSMSVSSLLFKITKDNEYIGYVIVRESDKVDIESALSTSQGRPMLLGFAKGSDYSATV